MHRSLLDVTRTIWLCNDLLLVTYETVTHPLRTVIVRRSLEEVFNSTLKSLDAYKSHGRRLLRSSEHYTCD